MCFNIYWSAGWATVGLAAAWYVKFKTSNSAMAAGVFFFFLMEFLQVVQYLFIADDVNSPVCATTVNQVLTVLGLLHICLQPYFLHSMNCSLIRVKFLPKEKVAILRAQYAVVKKLCLIGGFLIFLRFPMSYIQGWSTLSGKSTEWLRGDNLCTYKNPAMFHLGWSVPMADPTYNIMGIGLHCFLMFAPFFAMTNWSNLSFRTIALDGAILYATGPFFASLVTDNLQEQASVWCLFSIVQVLITLGRTWTAIHENYPVKAKK